MQYIQNLNTGTLIYLMIFNLTAYEHSRINLVNIKMILPFQDYGLDQQEFLLSLFPAIVHAIISSSCT